MGRKPKRPDAVPRLRERKQRSGIVHYYYDHGGKPRREEPLGSDYALALKRWAEIEGEDKLPRDDVLTLEYIWKVYQRSNEYARKSDRTRKDHVKEAEWLLEFFNDPPAPLDAITPLNVAQYKRWRTKGGTAFVRANREMALLSVMWNWAREYGYTTLPNPCAGVKRNPEKGRDAYIEDAEYLAIMEAATPWLRDAMELAYLTGQRPADVLGLSEHDIRDGYIHVRADKTQQRVRIGVVAGLPEVLARIRERKVGHKVVSTRLIVNKHGRPIGTNAVSRWWRAACNAAGVQAVQFRDLRAKAATDVTDAGQLRDATKLLAHKKQSTTERYVRNRRGAIALPPPDIAERTAKQGIVSQTTKTKKP